MKILVSTAQTQKQRKNDFCFVPDDEMVMFGFICDRDRADPDGGCGCGRSMVGVKSKSATTTFTVMEMPDMTRDLYRKAIEQANTSSGWKDAMPADEFEAMVDEDTDELLRVAEHFDVGTVLEKRLEQIQVRCIAPIKTRRNDTHELKASKKKAELK